MKHIIVPTNYYQHFDADFSLDVPAEGYGGCKKADLKLNPEKTAVVLMHAWDCGTKEEYHEWHRVVEYNPRENEISTKVFPQLLKAVRQSKRKLFHVVGPGDYFKEYPGYKAAKSLASDEITLEQVEADPVLEELKSFKLPNVVPGDHNNLDIECGFEKMNFLPEARPVGEEEIAENTSQLFGLCKKHGINHIIYALNACCFFHPEVCLI